MARKIEVYGVPHGGEREERLLALYVNPKIENGEILAKKCICEALEKRGCQVTSIRKAEVLEHELM